MLPAAAQEVLRLQPNIDGLLSLLAQITSRPVSELESELKTHLAARICFVLLGEVETATNYDVIVRRLAARLGTPHAIEPLTDAVARTLIFLDSAGDGRRLGLADLPYPIRRELFMRQGYRCAVCGWKFSGPAPVSGSKERAPTLDHRIPHRIGGEQIENLWILCALCNSIKEATIHVGEHGRIWSNNYVYSPRLRPVAFWTIMRERFCRESSCNAGPNGIRLYVERIHHRGAWVLDNCTVRCSLHVTPSESIDY